ncbi:MAG: hypothetical protein IJG07_13010 [Prevotella sp.]|nr:hypothetical protein [Prevotella sp.]
MKRFLIFALLIISTFLSAFSKDVGVYCFFNDKQTIYEDTYIKVALIAVENSKVQLVAYNKSDTILYIDNESSFAYTNNVPQNTYKNSAVTVGNISVNGLATFWGRTFGSTLISGVYETTAVFEKKVIPVAPHWATILYVWDSCDDLIKKRVEQILKLNESKKQVNVKDIMGSVRTFAESNAPLTIKAVTKYSLEKDLRNSRQITVSNYVEYVVVDDVKGVSDNNFILSSCQPYHEKQCVKFSEYFSVGRSSILLDTLFGLGIIGAIAGFILIL